MGDGKLVQWIRTKQQKTFALLTQLIECVEGCKKQ